MDNAVNAKIVNKGRINLAGPLVVGFEIQSDTIGSGGRTVENDGTITDEIENSKETPNLGGLKVGKVDEDGKTIEGIDENGNVVGRVNREDYEEELTLPPFARKYPVGDTLKIKRTPDIVDKNGNIKNLVDIQAIK